MQEGAFNELLKPSGINDRFIGSNFSFEDYLKIMQKIVREGRKDLTDATAGRIINANSPFQYLPQTNKKPKKGILLIHGLFDSPFYVKDLANYFVAKGFIVRAILLPGHGTVPGDLLNMHYEEWVKAAEYGLRSLAREVEHIYIGGYSLGGILAIDQVLQNTDIDIASALLFAPALKPRSRIKELVVRYHRIFSWPSSRSKWYLIRESNNFTKYSCYSYNAGYQTCKLLNKVETTLKQKQLHCPLFVVISRDDETISDQAVLSFFSAQPHPKNKLILYTNTQLTCDDKRIVGVKSHFPDLNILDFSHTCLTISPHNPVLGSDSNYCDFTHYNDIDQIRKSNILHGAVTKNNLKKYTLSRLSYNPDFENLLQQIDQFLTSLEEPPA